MFGAACQGLAARMLRPLMTAVVAPVVVALGDLPELFRRRLALRVPGGWSHGLRKGFAGRFLHLVQGCLTLTLPVDRFLLCRTQPGSRMGGVKTIAELAGRVGYPLPIGRIILPATAGVRQVLPADFVEVINVNIDIVITVAVIAAVMIPVIIVMMVIPVVIPVDIAEEGIGGRHAQAEA